MSLARFSIAAILATALVATAARSGAQTPTPGNAANHAATGAGSDVSMFAPLSLAPAPSPYRLASGAPGPRYWQNRADYHLRATLDTTRESIQASMTLRYTNNSPHTLNVIWIQTEQNRFRGTQPQPGDGVRLQRHGEQYGYTIDTFTQKTKGRFVPVVLDEQGTITKVTLAEPLKPGKTATFKAAWHFVVPPSGNRMGHTGTLYDIAQWYPRVNVYDDLKGWNIEPYRGREFFLEYGDFTLEVTVPTGYVVAATGTLDNARDVLTPAQVTRLARAATADTVIHIITSEEARSNTTSPSHAGTRTWKFHAKNVRDAVWCASPEYQWDAIRWKGVLVQAYYRPPAADRWEDAADMAKMSVQEYSERWFMYPYPQISVVEGLENGMEYPMLTMIHDTQEKPSLYGVITHEVSHNWFPMIVGSNERMDAWMDEGFSQYINTFSEARRYPETSQYQRAQSYASYLESVAESGQDTPLLVPADDAVNYGAQYMKTAGLLHILREEILGPKVFDKAMRVYIRRWKYKHPTPVDFFRTMEDVSGRHLDWFWRDYIIEAPLFDQSVDAVTQSTQGDSTHVTVRYGNHKRGVLPILARFTFGDGSKQTFTYPAEVWQKDSVYTVSYTFTGKIVTTIHLDPDHRLTDTNRANNEWKAPPALPKSP